MSTDVTYEKCPHCAFDLTQPPEADPKLALEWLVDTGALREIKGVARVQPVYIANRNIEIPGLCGAQAVTIFVIDVWPRDKDKWHHCQVIGLPATQYRALLKSIPNEQ